MASPPKPTLISYYEQAGRLLDIPADGPDAHEARMEILAMIKAAHRKRKPLPDYEELRRKFNTGQPLQSMTFGEYWNTWVDRHRRLKDLRKTTLRAYIMHHDVHVSEILDQVRLDRIFAGTVERVFTHIDEKNADIMAARKSDDLETRRSMRHKRLTGHTTKQRVKATIQTVLADAMREHLVTFNAASLVSLGPGKRAKGMVWTKTRVEAFNQAFEERLRTLRADPARPRTTPFHVWGLTDLRPSPVMVWTPAQLGTFLDHAIADRLYALFHLVAFRGLRRGEACGVRWIDLDLDEGVLSVAKQLIVLDGQVEEGDPKTESSDGVVASTGVPSLPCTRTAHGNSRKAAMGLRVAGQWSHLHQRRRLRAQP
ncbi:hypothetical protein [Nonomuraea insulae]|uniref:Tyr recombinase domain-containing protein n=1 Tax=Nonomuraea insulae TaxID=1616787 RepID=A0ABW1D4H0_9ACTN